MTTVPKRTMPIKTQFVCWTLFVLSIPGIYYWFVCICSLSIWAIVGDYSDIEYELLGGLLAILPTLIIGKRIAAWRTQTRPWPLFFVACLSITFLALNTDNLTSKWQFQIRPWLKQRTTNDPKLKVSSSASGNSAQHVANADAPMTNRATRFGNRNSVTTVSWGHSILIAATKDRILFR